MGPLRKAEKEATLPLTVEQAPSKPNGAIVAAPEGQPSALTPVELLHIAVSQGADIEKLKQLMDLQERWEKNEARKAFVVAMSRFKANPPTIMKNKRVHFETTRGATDYNHATLDHVCDEVTKGLSAVGITHAWKVAQERDGLIAVTCVLTHELGHSETTQLMGFPDDSGGKNKIQAIGSTVSYLSRYTLMAACGLASKDTDDDGQEAGKPFVEATKIEEYCRQMSEVYTLDQLKAVFKKAYEEAQEMNDRKAMAHYVAAKDKKLADLKSAQRKGA